MMTFKLLFPLLIVSVLLSACSTPGSRARSHSDLMASLSPEERAQVEAGDVDLGFTEEMVLIALGEPDRKYSERTAEGETRVWAYHAPSRPRFSLGLGTSIGGGSRGSAYGGGVSVGTGGRLREEERMRVVFAEGRVIGIERAEKT